MGRSVVDAADSPTLSGLSVWSNPPVDPSRTRPNGGYRTEVWPSLLGTFPPVARTFSLVIPRAWDPCLGPGVAGKVSSSSENCFWQCRRGYDVGEIERDKVVVVRETDDVIPCAWLKIAQTCVDDHATGAINESGAHVGGVTVIAASGGLCAG